MPQPKTGYYPLSKVQRKASPQQVSAYARKVKGGAPAPPLKSKQKRTGAPHA